MQHDWPGNIRELQNAVQRYLAGERLHFIDTRPTPPNHPFRADIEGLSLREAVEAYEKRLIARVLEQNGGNTENTAHVLNIPLRTLYGKIKKYQLR